MSKTKTTIIVRAEDANPNSAIRFNNVEFTYSPTQKSAVDNVSFELQKGQYVCIIGHNGSGKSTISKLITGILKPQKGKIYIENILINRDSLTEIRRKIGIVFQNPDNQFIGSTVEDDIAFGLENRLFPHKEMQRIIQESAAIVGMEKFLRYEPQNLSGGQKQRVAIAGILAINPPIIIFDESTSMLDPKGKKDIKDLILKLKKDNPDKTIISITHDMNEVVNSDYVLVMEQGKLVKTGKPQEIFINEESLKKLKLDLPFAGKLSYLLEEQGIKINKTIHEKELIGELCK